MSPPNQLRPGAPVLDGECWSRALTNTDHVTREGTVHHSALTGSAFLVSEITPYSHELSGRLVSLANDIVQAAQDRVEAAKQKFLDAGKAVPSKIALAGIACATAGELRPNITEQISVNVIFTPLPGVDEAHADVVTAGSADGDLKAVGTVIAKRLRVVLPESFATALSSCGRPSPTTGATPDL